MKKELFNNAMNHIDSGLVEEFVKERDALQKKLNVRKSIMRVLPTAACFVFIFTVAVVVFLTNNSMGGANSFPDFPMSPPSESDQIKGEQTEPGASDDFIQELNSLLQQLNSGMISTSQAMEELEKMGIDVENWKEATAEILIKLTELQSIYVSCRDKAFSTETVIEITVLYEQAKKDIYAATSIDEMNGIIERFEQEAKALLPEDQ